MKNLNPMQQGVRTAAVLLWFATTVFAQTTTVWPPPLPQLSEMAPPSASAFEVTIRWRPALPSPAGQPEPVTGAAPQRNDFEVTARRSVSGMPPRQRDPQLSPDDLVIVAVDAKGTDVAWHLIKDPSLIRAETPTASGSLKRETFRRSDVTFPVTLPAVTPEITELRVYKPEWNGTAFVLDLVGTVSVPQTGR